MAARPVSQITPQQWWQRASAAGQSGDHAALDGIVNDAIAAHPNDAELINNLGSLLLKSGLTELAVDLFSKACAFDPRNIGYAINHAIALSNTERQSEAIAALLPFEQQGVHSALYCSTRGTCARGLRDLVEATKWYDRALALEPGRAKALHGRARVAIERGEASAGQRFDQALAANQGDADLWLGKAQAMDVAGDHQGARNLAEQLVRQAPQWIEGLKFLAQIRLGQGEKDFASHFGDAVGLIPQDPNIRLAWCSVLAGLDFNEQAAEIANSARSAFPEMPEFALSEAIYAGAAGDDARAEGIFSQLELKGADRDLHEARHRIRMQQYDRAEALLDRLMEADRWSISAWALRGVLWRLINDPQSAWLSEQAGLVTLMPLIGAETVLPQAIPLLHKLHNNSPLPLGQSLRGGSQTRGILFDRSEPEFSALHGAIQETVKAYQAALPEEDAAHPLLRHRKASWNLAGSWSVRLNGGGDFHTAHIHPQGIVSSALYLELPEPDAADPMAGWLEIGRPAPDLRTGLGPLATIEPKVGHLALFPSTLYHGTRPFKGARRMTVAFDVTLRQGAAR